MEFQISNLSFGVHISFHKYFNFHKIQDKNLKIRPCPSTSIIGTLYNYFYIKSHEMYTTDFGENFLC